MAVAFMFRRETSIHIATQKINLLLFSQPTNQLIFEILEHWTTKSWKKRNSLVISGIWECLAYWFYKTQLYWSMELFDQTKNIPTKEIKQQSREKLPISYQSFGLIFLGDIYSVLLYFKNFPKCFSNVCTLRQSILKVLS